MSIATVIILTAIISLSVAAIFLAEEPIDSLTEVEAAILGIGMKPLATKLHFNNSEANAKPAMRKAGWQASSGAALLE